MRLIDHCIIDKSNLSTLFLSSEMQDMREMVESIHKTLESRCDKEGNTYTLPLSCLVVFMSISVTLASRCVKSEIP